MKIFIIAILMLFLSSCSRYQPKETASMPRCLQQKIDSLAKIDETPISVSRFHFRGQTVYYLKSACCDKYNIVFDARCNILGYPDGGYTGKADGSLSGFRDSANNRIIIWPRTAK